MITNLLHGGAQEYRKRSGTENLPGIVGFGKACELAEKVSNPTSKDYRVARLFPFRDHEQYSGCGD